jgi:hypothetical protein
MGEKILRKQAGGGVTKEAGRWGGAGREISQRGGGRTVGDGTVGDGTVGDGTVGDGTVGDGTVGDGTVGGVFPGDKSFVRPGNGLKAGGVSGSAGNPLKNYASRDETTVLQTTGGFSRGGGLRLRVGAGGAAGRDGGDGGGAGVAVVSGGG